MALCNGGLFVLGMAAAALHHPTLPGAPPHAGSASPLLTCPGWRTLGNASLPHCAAAACREF
eukprot:7307413-Heterocapsa_arctica.AAC.1